MADPAALMGIKVVLQSQLEAFQGAINPVVDFRIYHRALCQLASRNVKLPRLFRIPNPLGDHLVHLPQVRCRQTVPVHPAIDLPVSPLLYLQTSLLIILAFIYDPPASDPRLFPVRLLQGPLAADLRVFRSRVHLPVLHQAAL